MRLTKKSNVFTRMLGNYEPSKELITDKDILDYSIKLMEVVGELEDIKDILEKLTFYGKIANHSNNVEQLKFTKIYNGREYPADIRVEFKLKSGLGNIFYHVWDYGKTWALTREELL